MSIYQDQWTRYHHKSVTEANPIPSNNGWIYTAYAVRVGLPVNYVTLDKCYDACKADGYLTRSPGKAIPPISRDEILGLAGLGILSPADVKGWNFSPYPIPRFNPIKLVKQLLEVRGKHRNYFWQNNLDQMYRFAFSVPLVDRHFILRSFGKFNPFYFAISLVDRLLNKPSGITFLKYGKGKKEMLVEFPEDHPIIKAVR